MKVTEHALKRLALLTMDSHSQKEILFIHRFLLPGTITIHWNHGVHINDIALFAKRCDSFGGKVLGLETWFDSPYPLYTFSWEYYFDTYNSGWYHPVIEELESLNIREMIIPTVEFPEYVLKKYGV